MIRNKNIRVAQQNEISAYTLLALCDITENDSWDKATNRSLGVTKGTMQFLTDNYKKVYAANTRETVRRQVLHQFVQARIVDYNPDKPKLPVNNPKAHYALTEGALNAIKTFGTKDWDKAVIKFKLEEGELSKRNKRERTQILIPVKLSNGKTLKLSPGKHNIVQAAIVQDFAARFANGSSVLYLGDTANKDLYVDKKVLEELGIPVNQHSKLPDVIIYDHKKN